MLDICISTYLQTRSVSHHSAHDKLGIIIDLGAIFHFMIFYNAGLITYLMLQT